MANVHLLATRPSQRAKGGRCWNDGMALYPRTPMKHQHSPLLSRACPNLLNKPPAWQPRQGSHVHQSARGEAPGEGRVTPSDLAHQPPTATARGVGRLSVRNVWASLPWPPPAPGGTGSGRHTKAGVTPEPVPTPQVLFTRVPGSGELQARGACAGGRLPVGCLFPHPGVPCVLTLTVTG